MMLRFAVVAVVLLLILGIHTSYGRKSGRNAGLKKGSSSASKVQSKGKKPIKTSSKKAQLPLGPPIPYNMSVITWNLAEKKPSEADCAFLKEFRSDDFVVTGVQECENIKPRREEGHRSRAWRSLQKAALGKQFTCLAQHRMGGMQIAVFVKKSVADQVQGVQTLDVACGVGNVLTNKGCVCVLLRLRGKTIALVNAHLAAHVGKVKERNADYRRIMSALIARAHPRWLNRRAVLDHQRKYPHGDPVSRLDLSGRYFHSAKKFGDDLRAQYQPLMDQMFNAIGLPNERGNGYGNGEKNTGGKVKSKRAIVVAGKGKRDQMGQKGQQEGQTVIPTRPVSRIKKDRGTKKRLGLKLKKPRKAKGLSESTSRGDDSSPGGAGAANEGEDVGADEGAREEVLDDHWPFDATVFFGDLNYRLDVPRLEVELFKATRIGGEGSSGGGVVHGSESGKEGMREGMREGGRVGGRVGGRMSGSATDMDPFDLVRLEGLLEYDQLTRERILGRAFKGFTEGVVSFMPTFKYDKGYDRFDSSGKHRPPAWTDRILYRPAETGWTGRDGVDGMATGMTGATVKGAGATNGTAAANRSAHSSATAAPSTTATATAESSSSTAGAAGAAGAAVASPTPDPKSTQNPSAPPSPVALNSSSEGSLKESEADILQLVNYSSIDSRHSDHRPVSARFIVTV